MVGHDDAVHAQIGGDLRVLRIHDAFKDQRPVPFLAEGLDALGMADDLAEVFARRARHFQRPAGREREIDQVGQRRADLDRQAVLGVVVALAQHRQVHRHHQRRAVRGPGPADQVQIECAVLGHVKLEPERRRDRPGHILDHAYRHGEGHAERLGGAGDLDFACDVLHARRVETDGQLGGLAEQGRIHLDPGDVDAHPLTDQELLEIHLVRADAWPGFRIPARPCAMRPAASTTRPAARLCGRGGFPTAACSSPLRARRRNAIPHRPTRRGAFRAAADYGRHGSAPHGRSPRKARAPLGHVAGAGDAFGRPGVAEDAIGGKCALPMIPVA